jgi:hypothetical protein
VVVASGRAGAYGRAHRMPQERLWDPEASREPSRWLQRSARGRKRHPALVFSGHAPGPLAGRGLCGVRCSIKC